MTKKKWSFKTGNMAPENNFNSYEISMTEQGKGDFLIQVTA